MDLAPLLLNLALQPKITDSVLNSKQSICSLINWILKRTIMLSVGGCSRRRLGFAASPNRWSVGSAEVSLSTLLNATELAFCLESTA